MSNWIGTSSGAKIDLTKPEPSQITIEDIASALSKICRFNGHVKQFYSVAQHSMYVAALLPNRLKLEGLLHDASEAYICDIPTPLKRELGEAYKKIEDRIQAAISVKFNVNLFDLNPLVKQADRIMVVSERDFLHETVADWGPEYENVLRYPGFFPGSHDQDAVKRNFIRRFNEYSKLER